MNVFQIWVMAFVTLALFSFMYKDNPFYKIAEHLFAGLSVGYQIGLVWHSVILESLWNPMTKGNWDAVTIDTLFNSDIAGKWWLFIPGILGLLMFTRFSQRYSWVSRISLAFVMGVSAGVAIIAQLHGLILRQIQNTMLPLFNGGGFGATLLSLIIVIGVISTIYYFYFSHEHKGVLGVTAKVGIWYIMIAFGAHFGYTVMGRVSLLIGRVQFLINDWIGSFGQLF